MITLKNLKKFMSRSNDKADGTIVLFLFSVPLFILVLGLAINTNSAIQNKNEYNSMAQTSAETGVKSINTNGSLGQASVNAFVSEHRAQMQFNQAINTEICQKMNVNGTMRNMPYYEIKLDTARGGGAPSGTWIVEGQGEVPTLSVDPNVKYRVISANVYTSSQNLFGDFGLPPCQLHKSSVSAIAFGTNADL